MGIMAAIVRESSIGDATVRVTIPVCTDPALAVVFLPIGAALAILLAAGVALRPDAHTVSDLYPFPSLITYANGNSDNLVADTTWIQSLPLAMRK